MLPNPYAKLQESARFYITRRLLGVAVLILFVFGGAPEAAMRLLRPAPAPRAPMPLEPPPLGWTTDGASLAPPVIHALYLGKLPPPDPRQRKAPCDTEMEVEIAGWCWVPIAKDPCPKGKAYAHDGGCFTPALRAEKLPPTPTTGQPFPVTVAGEPE